MILSLACSLAACSSDTPQGDPGHLSPTQYHATAPYSDCMNRQGASFVGGNASQAATADGALGLAVQGGITWALSAPACALGAN